MLNVGFEACCIFSLITVMHGPRANKIIVHCGARRGTKYKSILGNSGIHLGMIVFRREVVKDA